MPQSDHSRPYSAGDSITAAISYLKIVLYSPFVLKNPRDVRQPPFFFLLECIKIARATDTQESKSIFLRRFFVQPSQIKNNSQNLRRKLPRILRFDFQDIELQWKRRGKFNFHFPFILSFSVKIHFFSDFTWQEMHDFYLQTWILCWKSSTKVWSLSSKVTKKATALNKLLVSNFLEKRRTERSVKNYGSIAPRNDIFVTLQSIYELWKIYNNDNDT